MKQVMENLGIDEKVIKPRVLLAKISNLYKNNYVFPESVADKRDYTIYNEYQKLLKKNNALDFDDILMYTVKLLEIEEVLDRYQKQYRYICVDEYQDTNRVQYLLIKLLGSKYNNVCVIWDADQSIYSFRGADINNILDFEKDFGARIIKLEQNYRSTQMILNWASLLISNNKWRHHKDLFSSLGEGERIKVVKTSSERSEWDFVAEEIAKLMSKDMSISLSDFAVFYRSNAQSRAIEEAFMRNGIVYKIIGALKFYSRKEIKDVLSYLRFISSGTDSVALVRIINNPSRKIGISSVAKLQNYSWLKGISIWDCLKHVDIVEWLGASSKVNIAKFSLMIEELRKAKDKMKLSEFIDYVLDKTWYLKSLEDEESVESQSRIDNLLELKSVATKFDWLESWALEAFLEEVALVANDDVDFWSNAVHVMTIHAAKWLEFNNVFVVGMEEGIFPSSRSLDEDYNAEEERRLAYVAMTRAKKRLYLVHARSRMLYWQFLNNLASRFLSEINQEEIETIDKVFDRGGTWVNVPNWVNI